MQGNFTNLYQYSAAETSQWRSSIVVKVLDNQLHRSEGPACNIFAGGCPVAPGPGTISTNFTIDQSAPFVELSVNLQIMNANDQTIVCTGILLEQRLTSVNTAVSYLPLALALYSGSVSLASIILRATEESGFIGALATYGLASTSDIISVHTPGLFDIIFYAQFMVMTGQLSLNYPSFYVTFTSLFHWSFLEFPKSFAGNGPENSTYVLDYGGAGSVNQINGPIIINENNNSDPKKRSLPELWNIDFYSSSLPTPTSTSPLKYEPSPDTVTPYIQKRQDITSSANPNSSSPPASPASPTGVSPSTSNSPSPSPISPSPSTQKPTPKPTATKPTNATLTAPSTTSPSLIIPTLTDPFNLATVKLKQYNVSRFGMEAYAAAIGAYPTDLFLGTFINTIIAAGISLFISAFLLTVAWSMAKDHHQKGKTLQHAFSFVTGNLVRVWSLFYTPLALSAMYQLTVIGNTTMMAVASVSLLIFSVGVTIIVTWRILRASGRFLLFEDQETLLKYGALYNTLAEEGTLFFLVNLLVRFLWGLSVAMLSSYGVAQVSVLLAVEFGYLLVIGFKWPYFEPGDSKFHLLMGFVRIVVTGCSIAYVPDLDVPAKTKQVFAYAQMALHLAVLIIMFALILWNTIQVYLFWQSRHTRSWKGPAKPYNLDDSAEGTNWAASRPQSRITDPGMVRPIKSRQYTVQPYSSIGDLGTLSEDNLIGGSPSYRRSHIPPGYSRSRFLSNNRPGATLDLHSDSIIPLSSSPSPMSIQSVTSIPHSTSVDSIDGPAIPLQPTQLSGARSQAPRESYAKNQRLTHQQGTPDLRNRRMSEIFRDGGYLYEPGKAVHPSPKVTQDKKGVFKSLVGSVGGLLTFSKRTVKRPTSIGSKPKAFEVIRPSRHPPVMDTADDASQVGDDLKELNSIGISRFFQESGLNNDRKGNLFVANPEVGLSRNGSVRSSVSGFPQARPELGRNTSAHSARSATRPKHATSMSTDLNSIYSGFGSMASEVGHLDGRRVSTTSAQHNYSRVSLENNIADVLRSETPFRLQGGGVIKVSKGPEKSVQYWRKESGQYIESNNSTDNIERKQSTTVIPAPPPIILLPATLGYFDNIQVDTSKPATAAPSVKSRAGSRPESPTESLQSTNVVTSAGKMHEILDRMFSDQDDDSDTISDGDETCSTFSGRVSATILALQQKREHEEYLADAQSVYRAETLEPVLEHHDLEADRKDDKTKDGDSTTGIKIIPQNLNRSPSGTIIRTLSGTSKLTSASPPSSITRPLKNNLSSRPLAQTPLHSPSVLSFTESTASLLLPGTLSRQSSRTSLGESPSLAKREPEVIASQLDETHDTKALHPLQEESVDPKSDIPIQSS
ncbi:hypothetical protein BGZ76_002572 [Entomortierella beljakovae]|nr:hypothetical protein BGZ76_002572 [Entomortierella beljakovae]